MTVLETDDVNFWVSDENHCNGVWRNVSVTLWRGELKTSHLRDADERWESITRKTGQIAILTIVLPGAPPPSSAVRPLVKRLYETHVDDLLGVCTCLEGGGLSASAGAMAMSTLNMLVRPSYPVKVTNRWTDGTMWISENCEVPHSGLIRAVKDIETRYRNYLDEQGLPFVTTSDDFSLAV